MTQQVKKLLVIDKDAAVRTSLKEVLEYESYKVDVEKDTESAFKKICKGGYDLIMSELQMPGMNGITLLQKLREQDNYVPFIVFVKEVDLDEIVSIMKNGANNVLQKPLNLNKLITSIRQILEENKTESRSSRSGKKCESLPDPITEPKNITPIIGNSEAMRHILQMVDRLALTTEKVIILGENGTGKELVARRIHEYSRRRDKPFVAVNCAAIPLELIESQLFGHEKGSFTSAIKMHKGDFEKASGGTLFLDEIGDMSLAAQAKILRALQEKRITRVGGEDSIPVDVRVIAATNKDLRKEIREGRFREDLYHRLSVVVIRMPSLAERKEDIPLLIDYFLEKKEQEYENKKMRITEEAIYELQQLAWTGNVRELENYIERLCIFCDEIITADDVKKYASYY